MMIVYITCKGQKQAKGIAKALLSERLIACANIFPVQSLYKWKGKVQDHQEYVLLGKSRKNLFSAIKKRVEHLHSYDVPCIELISSKANKAFEQWVGKETKNP